MSKITFSIGGVHPDDAKIARGCAIEVLPLPQTLYVSMAQHLGAPAKPIVAVGDKVLSSGLGSVYPADLVIGKVESVDADDYNRAKVAKVRPAVDFSELRYLLVVTSYSLH